MTYEDLLPGEFGKIISFGGSYNNHTEKYYGVILYNIGDKCIIIKTNKDLESFWEVNGKFSNNLYYIKKVKLTDNGFVDIEEPAKAKEFKPFNFNISVETEEDMALLWAAFGSSNYDYKALLTKYHMLKDGWDCDSYYLWQQINDKIKEMTDWRQ